MKLTRFIFFIFFFFTTGFANSIDIEGTTYYSVQFQAILSHHTPPLKNNLRWWIKNPRTGDILYFSRKPNPIVYFYPGDYQLVVRYRQARIQKLLHISPQTLSQKKVNFKAGTLRFFILTTFKNYLFHHGPQWSLTPAPGSLGNENNPIKTNSQYPRLVLPQGYYDVLIHYGHYHHHETLHMKEGAHKVKTWIIPVGELQLKASIENKTIRRNLRWRVYLNLHDKRPVVSSAIATPVFYLPQGTYYATVIYQHASYTAPLEIHREQVTKKEIHLAPS